MWNELVYRISYIVYRKTKTINDKRLTINQTGQSLMELVVVVAVVVIVVGALTFATIASLRNANFAKNQAQATKLAQEGLEKIRSLRDRDTDVYYMSFVKFSNLFTVNLTCSTNNCYFFFNTFGVLTNATSVNSEPIGDFKRQFFIEDYGTDQKKVTVAVTWIDVPGSHESRLTTILRKL